MSSHPITSSAAVGNRTFPLVPYGLSVLIPVYNEENTVAALLESVLSAPLPAGMSLEIVAVDDASRDSSFDILREYAERYPDTIRVYRHERIKVRALRYGLRFSRPDANSR